MKKKNRNFEIISLSALDLFAATLGAFFIVVTILMPYYPNLKDRGQELQRVRESIEENNRRIEAANEKSASLERERVRRVEQQNAAALSEAARADLARKAVQVRAQNAGSEKEIGSLRERLAELRSKIDAKKKAGNQGDTDFAILGITTKAKSIVLVVDLSGSMKAWTKTLVDTVLEIIDPFNTDVRFAILCFQDTDVSVIWPPTPLRMALADAKTKVEAQKFIRGFPALVSGGTPTRNALKLALNYNPEAIILVSDGEPDEHPDQVIDAITSSNSKKIEINTVAVGDYLKNSVLIKFLSELAKRNRGQFVGIMP